jgi:hypothetical protein
MRAAKAQGDKTLQGSYQNRDPSSLASEGRTQGTVGRTLGCAGMEERGAEKIEHAERRSN